jgi:hypothetical protein
MYLKQPADNKILLKESKYSEFCKKQAAQYKYADNNDNKYTLEERVALIPI